MKLLSLILSLTGLLFFGCQDDRLQLPKPQSVPSQVNLTSSITTAEISLSVYPPLYIQWVVSYKPDWIDIFPTAGDINTPITVVALTSTLLPQTLEDKIVFTTTTGKVQVPVKLTITTSNAVELAPSPLLFDYNENSRQVTIKNNSNQPTNWQIEPSAAYLSITPASGTLNANQSSELTLTINRNNLETKVYSEKLSLKLGGIKSSETPVSINNFKEDKWLLDGALTDAEYDRTNDNLIIIIGSKLFKLKPETKTEASVVLPFPGNCVSVGKNGQHAVVGHDGFISLVDLTAMTVEETYPVSTDAFDVVLAPNNWAYVFPKFDQWQNIRCINLSDGTEMLNTGRQIYAGTKAKLHPSGDYIYGANNGLSPSDAEKYDIRNGQADFLYDSPYHGQYEFGGDLWMEEDGSRMFTRSRYIYALSTDQSSDIIFAGAVSVHPIQTLDHISSKNLIYAVLIEFFAQSTQNQVSIYSSTVGNYLGAKPLPDFLVSGAGGFEIVPSEGILGFFNSTGAKFFVCVKSKAVSGSPVQWAVATINVD